MFERFSFVDELLDQINKTATERARDATAKGVINGMGKIQTMMFLYGHRESYQEGMNGFLTRLGTQNANVMRVHKNATQYATPGTDLAERKRSVSIISAGSRRP